MHNFAFRIGDKIVCGTFRDADKLRCNDRVFAIVAKRGEIFFAHSLRRMSDDLFMLPLNAVRGPDALFRSCMRVAWYFTLFLRVFIGLLLYTHLSMAYPGREFGWFHILFTLLVPPLIMFPFEFWTYQTMGSTGDYAEAIFRAYGIPRPESFDVTKDMTLFENHGATFFSLNFAQSLAEHKRKFRIKE